jgi:hypothetical protein
MEVEVFGQQARDHLEIGIWLVCPHLLDGRRPVFLESSETPEHAHLLIPAVRGGFDIYQVPFRASLS